MQVDIYRTYSCILHFQTKLFPPGSKIVLQFIYGDCNSFWSELVPLLFLFSFGVEFLRHNWDLHLQFSSSERCFPPWIESNVWIASKKVNLFTQLEHFALPKNTRSYIASLYHSPVLWAVLFSFGISKLVINLQL